VIRIERSRPGRNGTPIVPPSQWLAQALEVTELLSNAGRYSEYATRAADVWGSDDVRRALSELFYGRCAYCEFGIAGAFPLHVEHFRPKGRIAETDTPPGYYWLACTWDNLYAACQFCNTRNRDRGTQDQPVVQQAGGKHDQFPLRSEKARMTNPESVREVEDAARLLLDPCQDEPSDVLGFEVLGQPHAIDGSDRAERTIRVMFLDRTDKCAHRRAFIDRFVGGLRNEFVGIIRPFVPSDSEAMLWDRFVTMKLDLYSTPGNEFAGIVRSIRRDPAAFGLVEAPS
jgi:uncharacterized protein (TIGR02646 family)